MNSFVSILDNLSKYFVILKLNWNLITVSYHCLFILFLLWCIMKQIIPISYASSIQEKYCDNETWGSMRSIFIHLFIHFWYMLFDDWLLKIYFSNIFDFFSAFKYHSLYYTEIWKYFWLSIKIRKCYIMHICFPTIYKLIIWSFKFIMENMLLACMLLIWSMIFLKDMSQKSIEIIYLGFKPSNPLITIASFKYINHNIIENAWICAHATSAWYHYFMIYYRSLIDTKAFNDEFFRFQNF